ncbi:mRNA surveillance protein pelota [Candidatus Thorarchaeota archaeon]|jgi:protein pelota|nr:MAG: mRNA surveillance protein pelota [Candidatus Thorarchaeota archaeon]
MKVLKRSMKDGLIVLKIETLDDLWHLYNIVGPEDVVISRTSRRVRIGDEDSRKQESIRKTMVLKLLVEEVSFHTFSNRIRIKGTIQEGPADLVNIGSYHTINIEPGDTLSIIKEHWPKFILSRIKEATRAQLRPKALIVTIEDGVAELFLAADFGIRETVRVRATISRKRGDQKSYDATMNEFFSDTTLAVRSQLEQHDIGLVVIAGPGFVKDHFKDALLAAKIKNLPPVVTESTNSIGIPGAKEVLYRGVIARAITELKVETETRLVEALIEHISKDDGLGAYGDDEVTKAVQYGAVEDLLITDKKLREGSEAVRRKMDHLVRDTEKTRGVFHVVSTDHPAGDQLERLGGLGAILRFRIDYS